MITEQQRQKNYQLFLKKLNGVGVETTKLNEKFGEKIMNATYCTSPDRGPCYDGSFLEIILRTLTPHAVKYNSNTLDEDERVDQNTLVKICLLHQIGKALSIIPNDDPYEVEKRGILYKFDNSQPPIRTGLLSISMCQDSGIFLDSKEMGYMTIMDTDATDKQAKYHSESIAYIVKEANEYTYRHVKAKK